MSLRNTKVSRAGCNALVSAAVATLIASQGVQAQEAEDGLAGELGEITVTGSRVRDSSAEGMVVRSTTPEENVGTCRRPSTSTSVRSAPRLRRSA